MSNYFFSNLVTGRPSKPKFISPPLGRGGEDYSLRWTVYSHTPVSGYQLKVREISHENGGSHVSNWRSLHIEPKTESVDGYTYTQSALLDQLDQGKSYEIMLEVENSQGKTMYVLSLIMFLLQKLNVFHLQKRDICLFVCNHQLSDYGRCTILDVDCGDLGIFLLKWIRRPKLQTMFILVSHQILVWPELHLQSQRLMTLIVSIIIKKLLSLLYITTRELSLHILLTYHNTWPQISIFSLPYCL